MFYAYGLRPGGQLQSRPSYGNLDVCVYIYIYIYVLDVIYIYIDPICHPGRGAEGRVGDPGGGAQQA